MTEQLSDAILVKKLRARVRDLTSILKGKETHLKNLERRLKEYKHKMHRLREENERLKALVAKEIEQRD